MEERNRVRCWISNSACCPFQSHSCKLAPCPSVCDHIALDREALFYHQTSEEARHVCFSRFAGFWRERRQMLGTTNMTSAVRWGEGCPQRADKESVNQLLNADKGWEGVQKIQKLCRRHISMVPHVAAGKRWNEGRGQKKAD